MGPSKSVTENGRKIQVRGVKNKQHVRASEDCGILAAWGPWSLKESSKFVTPKVRLRKSSKFNREDQNLAKCKGLRKLRDFGCAALGLVGTKTTNPRQAAVARNDVSAFFCPSARRAFR